MRSEKSKSPSGTGQRSASDEAPSSKIEFAPPLRLLTREELAEALQVSVRTIDAMVLEEGLPHLSLKGFLVRFYLPDVVRHLTATALTAKRRWPGVLGKTPNSKLQAPEKIQAPRAERTQRTERTQAT